MQKRFFVILKCLQFLRLQRDYVVQRIKAAYDLLLFLHARRKRKHDPSETSLRNAKHLCTLSFASYLGLRQVRLQEIARKAYCWFATFARRQNGMHPSK